MKSSLLAILGFSLFLGLAVRGQAVDVTDQMDNNSSSNGGDGEGKARQYFEKRPPGKNKSRHPASNSESSSSTGGDSHYLALHVGTYVDDHAYSWSSGDQHDVGNLNIGVTYRLGEWVNSADFLIRSEYSSYGLDDGTARKIDFLAMLMFPDSHSKFPLYFGAGIGPGFYLKQLGGHSVMSFDYQLVGGVRFMNVFDRLGFLAEFGLKSDFQLFSPGQFNGLFAGIGTVWTF